MSKHWRKFTVIVLVVVVVAGLIWFMSREKPVPVVIAKAAKGVVEARVANTRAGTVKACRRAHLAPAVGGQIASLKVREGDAVVKGEVLMELWNEDLAAQLRLAVTESRAARNRAEEVCLRAESAGREAKRILNLKKKGMAADEDVDRAVTNAKAQKAACEAANVGAQVSEAQIAVAQSALRRTILTAPFSGRIAEVNGEVGEFVTPSPPGIPTLPAVDLMDTSCVFVAAPFDEVDVPNVKPVMPANITLDAFGDRTFAGTVKRVAPYVLELEKQARTVDVEALFDDPKVYDILIPGYSADVEVILDVRKEVLRIPTEAVLENDRVLVFNNGRLEEKQIKTGLSNWKFTQVISGLNENERVVTSVGREGVEAGALASIESEQRP